MSKQSDDDRHPGDVERDRRLLTGVAYRMLGSASDAADAVQEAYTRWYALREADRARIASPTGWLVTVLSRICLDLLGSARARRERYVGEWLPEPVPGVLSWTSQADGLDVDPQDAVTLDDSVTTALLVVLDTMTPAERVAFVLHDVLGFTFPEIARIGGRTPQACRQLASSARRRLRERPRQPLNTDEHAHALTLLKSAWEARDIEGLVRALDPEVVAVTDGGGTVSASLEPIRGASAVASLLVEVFARQPDLAVQLCTVNGQHGLVARDSGDRVLAVISVQVVDRLIDRVWIVRNPSKLSAWAN